MNPRNALALALMVAAAGILHKAQPAVMPERRRSFENGYDLNRDLDDLGRHIERKSRKAERRERMQALQRAAAEGRA